MTLIKLLEKKAINSKIKIIFPEGNDERIINAAKKAYRKKICTPLLVSAKKGKLFFNHLTSKKLKEYAKKYSKKKKMSLSVAEKIMQDPLFYSAMALKEGDADAMIAGAQYTSGNVIAVSKDIIGLKKGIKVASSYFIMSLPFFKNKEGGNLIFADASVNPLPNAYELADIAITSAETAKKLLGWVPRVAMLSFSTKGSASHEIIDKIVQATKIANKKAPQYFIDGEMQGDAALIELIAKKKMKKIGKVGGKANVLIFPDLNAGNICYKLVQVLGRATAYGPILQGFNKPVSDLSRGAKEKDIYGVIIIMSILARRKK